MIAIGNALASMKGWRRPKREPELSDKEPMSGSATASMVSARKAATPAKEPDSPQTAVR